MNNNRKAFLDMLGESEGANYGDEGGYNIIVGSTRTRPTYFKSYHDHPRKLVSFTLKSGRKIKSTAAGKYQILARIFDFYRPLLHLDDTAKYPLGPFSPAAQDVIALRLISECKALPLIDSGDIKAAMAACSSRWASLPGAGYGQHENKVEYLVSAFTKYGGEITTV